MKIYQVFHDVQHEFCDNIANFSTIDKARSYCRWWIDDRSKGTYGKQFTLHSDDYWTYSDQSLYIGEDELDIYEK